MFATTSVEPIEASSTTACQFVVDYSWYNFFGTNSATFLNTYTSENSKKTMTAEFTYCQQLKNTGATHCSSTNYAAIYDHSSGDCLLNTESIDGMMTVDAATNDQVFTLVYSNTDAATNGGVSSLEVQQKCDPAVAEPVTGALTGSGSTYFSTQTSSTACPVFTANAFF